MFALWWCKSGFIYRGTITVIVAADASANIEWDKSVLLMAECV